jgi:hypothetical protein
MLFPFTSSLLSVLTKISELNLLAISAKRVAGLACSPFVFFIFVLRSISIG